MARFSFYQGESQTIEVEVLRKDGTEALLTGATIKAYLFKKNTAVELPYDITDNIISIELDAETTLLMYGAYDYEVSVVDIDQKIDLKVQDTFFVRPSYMAMNS